MEQDSPDLDTVMNLDDTMPKRRDTPMSPEEYSGSVPASVPTSLDPTPEPVQVSLASVDSEGSWFGKKTSVRRSKPALAPLTPPRFQHQRHASTTSFDSHHDPDLPTEDFADDDGSYFADETYDSGGFVHQRSPGSHVSHARASSDASDDARWGIVGGRTPNVVEPNLGFIKSHEGLLNAFSDDGHGSEQVVDAQSHMLAEGEDKENTPLRAKDVKRHSRGSVKVTAMDG